MSDAKGTERGPTAIICAGSSSRRWKLLNEALEPREGSQEFIFARSGDSPTDLLDLCRRLLPALVVIEELHLQTIPFKQLRDLIGRREIQILVFSDRLDYKSLVDFFQIGCTGVVQPNVTVQTLRKAVLAICEGELWLPRKVLTGLANQAFVKGAVRKVTQRESEIFRLICLGFTNQQIAEHLFISRETVRWHLRGLYSKIGVETRAGAIEFAKHGEHESDPVSNPNIP
jgi:DNA-binding NarL/FixJ family response regulator